MSRSLTAFAFALLALPLVPKRASADAPPVTYDAAPAPSSSSSASETPFPITKAPSIAPSQPVDDDDALAKKRRIGWLALAAAAVVAMLVFGTQTQPS